MACDGSPRGPRDDSSTKLHAGLPGPTTVRALRAAAGPVLAIAAAALILGPEPAAAQQAGGGAAADTVEIDTPYRWIPRGMRLGAVGGYLETGLNNLDLGPQSTPTGGLRGRARISSPISLEVSALYGSSDRFAVDPRLDGGPAPVDTLTSRWVLAEAAMQLAVTGDRTWHGLQPFAVLGGGFLVGVDEEETPAFSRQEEVSLRHDIDVMPVIQAGLGVEWHLGERFGLSFEARDHVWRITTPDGFFQTSVLEGIENTGGPAPEETSWTHNLEFSLTLYRYF